MQFSILPLDGVLAPQNCHICDHHLSILKSGDDRVEKCNNENLTSLCHPRL
ncbi:hypothetical protein JOB18_040668 [Solea senegalensis]|uniref:Uncharacterized protein n=1 Tax=Solea senegalensis TaxID=28829 RepID=A0AAV6Q118_SOLSE|nr:hypothetical protein JOB18_040668 [Solea senegalensis]